MPVYRKVAEDQPTRSMERVELDERFISLLLPEDPQDDIEAEELRALLQESMQLLTPQEFKVIDLRHQRKYSPGRASVRLDITRERLETVEKKALRKLRKALQAYVEG